MRSQTGLGTVSIGVTCKDYRFVNPENVIGVVVERYTCIKPDDIDGLIATVTCDTPIQHVRRLLYGHFVAKRYPEVLFGQVSLYILYSEGLFEASDCQNVCEVIWPKCPPELILSIEEPDL